MGLKRSFSGENPTLIVHNQDQPGHVAEVTSMLAQKKINIATLQLYRSGKGGRAVMVVECDQDVPEDGLEWLEKGGRNHQSDLSEESRRKISMEYHSIRQLEELCKTEQKPVWKIVLKAEQTETDETEKQSF